MRRTVVRSNRNSINVDRLLVQTEQYQNWCNRSSLPHDIHPSGLALPSTHNQNAKWTNSPLHSLRVSRWIHRDYLWTSAIDGSCPRTLLVWSVYHSGRKFDRITKSTEGLPSIFYSIGDIPMRYRCDWPASAHWLDAVSWRKAISLRAPLESTRDPREWIQLVCAHEYALNFYEPNRDEAV